MRVVTKVGISFAFRGSSGKNEQFQFGKEKTSKEQKRRIIFVEKIINFNSGGKNGNGIS